MVTQTQLRNLSRTQIRNVVQQENVASQQATAQTKAQEEYNQQLETYNQQVATQAQQRELLRQAESLLNQYVETQKNKGVLRASQMSIVDEAYQRAGYPEGYGKNLYISTLRGTKEWQKIQAISVRSVELGQPVSQESVEYYKRLEAKPIPPITEPSKVSNIPVDRQEQVNVNNFVSSLSKGKIIVPKPQPIKTNVLGKISSGVSYVYKKVSNIPVPSTRTNLGEVQTLKTVGELTSEALYINPMKATNYISKKGKEFVSPVSEYTYTTTQNKKILIVNPSIGKDFIIGEPIIKNKVIPKGTKEQPFSILGSAVGVSPYIVSYATPFVGSSLLFGQAVTGAETLKNIDKIVEEQKQKALKDYKENYIPEEGYEKVSDKEYLKIIDKDVRTSVKTGAYLDIGIPIAIGGAIGIYKGIKYVKEPIMISKPTRAIQEPVAKEIQFIKIQGEEIKTIGKYKILGEKTPPMIRYKTTRFRERFGLEPLKEYPIKPAKRFVVETIGWAEEGKPFLVMEKNVGGKVGKITRIEGDIQNIDRINIPQDNLRQFVLQRLAERKVGVPVSKDYIGKMFSEEEIIGLGNLDQIKLAKYYKRYKGTSEFVYTQPQGKSINRFLIASKSKLLKDNEFFQVYKIDQVAKDVTFPLGRATGKTPGMRTILFKMKKPITTSEESNIEFLTPADIEKTPLSKTFGEVSSGNQKLIMESKLLPLPKPNLNIPKTSSQISLTENLPSMVGGQGLLAVPYAGTMSYERTSAIQFPSLSQKAFVESKVITTTIQKPQEITKLWEGVKPSQVTQEKIMQQEKIIEKIATVQQQQQQQKQIQRQFSKQILRQVQKLKTPTPKTPTIKIPSTSLGNLLKSTVKKMKETQAYKVEVRKGGKFIGIGKPLPLGRALQLGVKETTTTLRQTFRLKPTGTTTEPDVTFNVPTSLFTRLKRPTAEIEYVERRGMTLKKGTGELPEIFKAQKSAQSKRMFFGKSKRRKSFI